MGKMYLCSMFYGRRGAVIHAMSGIDIALWDIVGKAQNKPIYKLLGGTQRERVRAYGSTLMPYTKEDAAQEALKWKEQGFTAVKMGWGGFELPFRDCVGLVESAHKAIGDVMDLMLDVGFIPSPDQPTDAASRLLLANELRQYSPYWLEELVSPDDYDGYRLLSKSIDTRIAGGENESTRYGFKQLIEYSDIYWCCSALVYSSYRTFRKAAFLYPRDRHLLLVLDSRCLLHRLLYLYRLRQAPEIEKVLRKKLKIFCCPQNLLKMKMAAALIVKAAA